MPTGSDLLMLFTFSLAGGFVWALIGGLVGSLRVGAPFAVIGVAYAIVFGLSETMYLPFRTPSSRWQVPSRWMSGRSASVRTLIWAGALGPGLITSNPFAGIWMVPIALSQLPFPGSVFLGLAAGVTHGLARAAGVIANSRSGAPPTLLLGKKATWRGADGIALLAFGGVLAVLGLPRL